MGWEAHEPDNFSEVLAYGGTILDERGDGKTRCQLVLELRGTVADQYRADALRAPRDQHVAQRALGGRMPQVVGQDLGGNRPVCPQSPID